MALIRSGLAITFLLAAQAWGQGALEIIPLRHRTADQVLPVLRPLLDPGATLTGQSNQIIVRTSPENLAELRRALEAIDRPARRLQVLVRFDDARDAASRDVSGSGVIGSSGARIELRAQDSRSGEYERIDQRLQVVEGGEAWIATGQSRPLQEASTGFGVVPRLSGRTVQLDIVARREALGPGGTVQGQRAATSAAGRLGEWFELGSVAAASGRDERGIGSSARAAGSDTRRVWVKVEELPAGERRN